MADNCIPVVSHRLWSTFSLASFGSLARHGGVQKVGGHLSNEWFKIRFGLSSLSVL